MPSVYAWTGNAVVYIKCHTDIFIKIYDNMSNYILYCIQASLCVSQITMHIMASIVKLYIVAGFIYNICLGKFVQKLLKLKAFKNIIKPVKKTSSNFNTDRIYLDIFVFLFSLRFLGRHWIVA